MIKDIPTPQEFFDASLNHLHLAFDIGMALARDLKNSHWSRENIDPEIEEEFWQRSQPGLSNGFTLIQQAQEFFLKGKIAAVSPYLLLTRDSRDWPRRCDAENISFSAFRMADAAELIKIHNTVSPSRIAPSVIEFCEEVRRQRNTLIHFGYKGQRIDVHRFFLAILRTNKDLMGEASWPARRDDYLNDSELAVIYSADWVGEALLYEFELLLEMLKPAEARHYFGFDKKARRYICPNCMRSAENERIALAQLRPNTPVSTNIHCFICGEDTVVERKSCGEKDCKSNVILEDGTCLVCW